MHVFELSIFIVSIVVNSRVRRSAHERKPRATSGFKIMEAALVVPQHFVDKYGEKEFQTVLLVIANMVRMVTAVFNCVAKPKPRELL